MDNWDDIRIFLSVARMGSVRGAAEALRVNHSTVIRRVSQLEARLGTKLFEKLPSGYQMTEAGQEILTLAEQMDETSSLLEGRVFGRDQSLSGPLRIALPPSLPEHLLLPDLVDFCTIHPEIELEILTSFDTVNLTNREADLAIRLVYDRATLPQHLFGTRLCDLFRGVYVSTKLQSVGNHPRWIIKQEDGAPPAWARCPGVDETLPAIKVSDLSLQIAAAKAGLGVSLLPCYVGDADPDLMRVPGSAIKRYGTLWLLTHGETRRTKRIRLFAEFIQQRLTGHRELLEGRTPAVN